jgi:hypothetical protein
MRFMTALLNYVATADKVVAIFPRFMGRLGADVGGAGHDGFVPPVVHDVEDAVGAHDAALNENAHKVGTSHTGAEVVITLRLSNVPRLHAGRDRVLEVLYARPQVAGECVAMTN